MWHELRNIGSTAWHDDDGRAISGTSPRQYGLRQPLKPSGSRGFPLEGGAERNAIHCSRGHSNGFALMERTTMNERPYTPSFVMYTMARPSRRSHRRMRGIELVLYILRDMAHPCINSVSRLRRQRHHPFDTTPHDPCSVPSYPYRHTSQDGRSSRR